MSRVADNSHLICLQILYLVLLLELLLLLLGERQALRVNIMFLGRFSLLCRRGAHLGAGHLGFLMGWLGHDRALEIRQSAIELKLLLMLEVNALYVR